MGSRIDICKKVIIRHCRDCRLRHVYTQKQLSALCGIHHSSLSIFENGRFSFAVAQAYYNNVMDPKDRDKFQRLINELKDAYLFSGRNIEK